MVFASYIRLALMGSGFLLSFVSQAEATSEFTSCVQNCITSSGCAISERCLCKEARELLLESVISCMFFNCKADLRNFEGTFLDPIEQRCDDADRDIPSSKIRAAESLASSYISKLPTITAAKSSTAAEAISTPTPKLVTSRPAPSSTSVEGTGSSSTSTSDSDRGLVTESTSTAEELTVAPTQVAVPSPATESSPATSNSPGSDSDSGSSFDSNPFGTPSSAASGIRPLLAFIGFPLAVAVLALR